MIDIHSHILPDVDDGSNNIKTSIRLLKLAKDSGFTDIVLTPHYKSNYYEVSKDTVINKINILKNSADFINIYEGNEIYLSTNTLSLLQENKLCTIANSRYVLVELPLNIKMFGFEKILFDLLDSNYIPIIAHPERYIYLEHDIELFKNLFLNGILFQCNYGSVIQNYGKSAYNNLKLLANNNMITCFGSDTHTSGSVYSNISTILKKLDKLFSKDQLNLLTTENPYKIINNIEF